MRKSERERRHAHELPGRRRKKEGRVNELENHISRVDFAGDAWPRFRLASQRLSQLKDAFVWNNLYDVFVKLASRKSINGAMLLLY